MPRDHAAGAERLGFTNPEVLSQSPSFLTGAGCITVPANYEPLDEPTRLFVVHRRKIQTRTATRPRLRRTWASTGTWTGRASLTGA